MSSDSTNNSERQKPNKTHEKHPLFNMMNKKPITIIAIAGIYIGIALILFGSKQFDILSYITQYRNEVVGVLILITSIIYLSKEIKILEMKSTDIKFTDVDKPLSDKIDKQIELENIRYEVERIFSLNQVKEPATDTKSNEYHEIDESIPMDSDFQSFRQYFNDIKSVLEDKALVSDKKASILLDKGVNYSRWGIIFFIISIIIWQLLAWITGFQKHYIYGMASCSMLFIFIEFLSAWFLKQYRHFVDTSTYLIKVKSIFDRYALTYLALKDNIHTQKDGKEHLSALLSILRDDIQWPDDYMFKTADVNFAKEFVQSLGEVAKNLKEFNAKQKSN